MRYYQNAFKDLKIVDMVNYMTAYVSKINMWDSIDSKSHFIM